MPIPEFKDFMTPTLKSLADGNAKTTSQIEPLVCEQLVLDEKDKKKLVPSGAQTIYKNRTQWALYYMYRAGLLDHPKRGVYQITSRGLDAIKTNKKIDNNFLNQYSEFRKFRSIENKEDNKNYQKEASSEFTDPVTRITGAIEEFNNRTKQALLEQLKKTDPLYFEKICLDLMQAMGYGDSLSLTPKSHDGGIDGIVNEDALGLDKIYLQAKRYADGKVNEKEMRTFIGALSTSPVTKGVFMTTSEFSDKARDKASLVLGKSIKLIDGNEMAGLMLKYNVGVRTVKTYQIKELDENFFSEEES